MAGDVLAAGADVIGAGLSLYGQKKQRDWEEEQAAIERQWNEQMLDKQNQFSLDMWNRTNEYNDPSKQYERLKNAGVNPLFYNLDGTGNASAMQSSSVLSSSRPTGVMNGFSAAAPYLGSIAKDIAEIQNKRADTAKKNNENLTETQRRENMLTENEHLKTDIELKKSQKGLTDSQKENLDKATSWIDRLNTAAVGYQEAQTKVSEATAKRIEALLEGEKLLQAKTLEDFDHRWAKISAEIGKIADERNLLKEDLENYALNHMSNGIMGSGASIQNILRSFIGIERPETVRNKAKQTVELMKAKAESKQALKQARQKARQIRKGK